MSKQKTGAQILVADGAGGLRQVEDLRFDAGDWPIAIQIPASNSETWLLHLHAEADDRGWSAGGLSQLDASESSGSLSLRATPGPVSPSLDIVWERPRRGDLRVRARGGGQPTLSVDVARSFIEATRARQRAGTTVQSHRRATLVYDGLPWRGELWLSPKIRLGPPTNFPESLIGPQSLVVDTLVEGIGWRGLDANFGLVVQVIRLFLGAVLGTSFENANFEQCWVPDLDDQLRITSYAIRSVGYVETSGAPGMPAPSSAPPVPRRNVTRPGVGPVGISSDMVEQWVPADIEQLWGAFEQLADSRRKQFLTASNAYSIACKMWPNQQTAYAAFLVVSCESLKPTPRRYEKMNIYDVVASLISSAAAVQLKDMTPHPQKVRSDHFHRGELAADELGRMLMNDYFMDPSFRTMLGNLSRVARVCLIEWLRREGRYAVVWLPRPTARGRRPGK